jgi:hypothetical protein
MCTMILNETISYYIAHDSKMSCVFLDATKAFDRVAYNKLFEILLEQWRIHGGGAMGRSPPQRVWGNFFYYF